MSFAKYFIFIPNLIIWTLVFFLLMVVKITGTFNKLGTYLKFQLFSVALIGIGVAVMADVKKVIELLPISSDKIAIGLIVVGCVLFVVAGSGCLGAVKEIKLLLIVYLVTLLIVLGIQGYVAYYVLSTANSEQKLKTDVTNIVDNYFRTHMNNTTLFEIETNLKCCGTTGGTFYTSLNMTVPTSCCEKPANHTCPDNTSYEGCITSVEELIKTHGKTIGYCLIAVLADEIIALCCTLYLLFKSDENRRKY